MIDAFGNGEEVSVELQSVNQDVFVEPLVLTVDVDLPVGVTLPLRAPKQDARFPFNVIDVQPLLLPIANTISIFPSLTVNFVIS